MNKQREDVKMLSKEELDDLISKTDHFGEKNLKCIGLEDTFEFSCKQCGSCCIGRQDIILNPFDVYRMSKKLNIDPGDFLLTYTEQITGSHSRLPMVTLKVADNGMCPFLKINNSKTGLFECSIQDAKPGACANHPIGVMFQENTDTTETNFSFIKVEQCENSKNSGKHNKVKNWVRDYIDHKEEIKLAYEIQMIPIKYLNVPRFTAFMAAIIKLPNAIVEIFGEEDLSSDNIEKTLSTISRASKDASDIFHAYLSYVYSWYTEYDTSKSFAEQAKAHLEEANEFLSDLNDVYEVLKDFIGDVFSTDIDARFDKMDQIVKEHNDITTEDLFFNIMSEMDK